MPLLSYTEAPQELLRLFNSEKESILARYYEPDPGLFIAESAKVTLRAADAGYELVSMLIEDSQMNQEARELFARFPEIDIYHAPSREFLEISGYPMTRGVLSLFRRKYRSRPDADTCASGLSRFLSHGANSSYCNVPDAGQPCSTSTDVHLPMFSRIAVLEEVGNPANVGSIFRNAAALGIDAVLLSKGCCDPLSRRCLRVSMGCVFMVPWTMTGMSGAQISRVLKEQGFGTAAMALSDHSVPVSDPSLKKADRLAVFLGNEGNGLPEETIQSCDYVVRIPMKEGVDSLNVAAASAVAFWECHP